MARCSATVDMFSAAMPAAAVFPPPKPMTRRQQAKVARAHGQRCGEAAEQNAVEHHDYCPEQARAFVVAYLTRHGPTSGEDLVDEMVNRGIRPKDRRAFGPLFQVLLNAGSIVCLRSDLPRRRGHGTSGGKLWARP